MKQLLLDTDVILDALFDRKPYSEAAIRVLDLCEKKQVKGYITAVCLSNTYYLLRRTASHKKVIEHLKELMKILDIAVIDKEIIKKALDSKFNDFEDALQNFAAKNHSEIDVILTRNLKDYKNSNLAVATPEIWLLSL